ncbi:MAG: dihydropteroate synthase [Planctomycetes bacterium]|nr:dihydropteroate synthase [Planctomycetota bacterium]
MCDRDATGAAAPPPHIHFVTGRLAARALREQIASLSESKSFTYSVDVLPISVAALMTTTWVAARIQPPAETGRIILPGYCQGDLEPIAARAGSASIERGPRDLRALPEFLGGRAQPPRLDDWSIEILAEINHAPRMDRADIVRIAKAYRDAGADWIDVGCEPGGAWSAVGDCVRALRDADMRVSIDSFDPREIRDAARAGAELVLSVNRSNREMAADWGCEVVAVPDEPASESSLDETIEFLADRNVPFRIDPILEPIGCGFARSLERYAAARRRHPDRPMLMGIGNLTEMTDCDSAAVNLLLLGLCEELSIQSVLTTQVVPWARSSVRECDVARRLVHFAVRRGIAPKRIDGRLVLLRDPDPIAMGREAVERLASELRDPHFRLFAEAGELHVVSGGLHVHDEDPFVVFKRLMEWDADAPGRDRIDASHAFYLGYEAAKAITAITLGKQYRQDEALDWGFLTRPERAHRAARARGRAADSEPRPDASSFPPSEPDGGEP